MYTTLSWRFYSSVLLVCRKLSSVVYDTIRVIIFALLQRCYTSRSVILGLVMDALYVQPVAVYCLNLDRQAVDEGD